MTGFRTGVRETLVGVRREKEEVEILKARC